MTTESKLNPGLAASVETYIANHPTYINRPGRVVDLDLKRGVDELREAEERREFRHVEQVMEGRK